MDTLWAGLLGTLGGGAILAGLGMLARVAWHNRSRPAGAVERRRRAHQELVQRSAIDEARSEVLARAKELGVLVPVARRGAEVTMSDGTKRYFYGSLDAYKGAMGPPPRTHPRVSSWHAAPLPLGQWPLDKVEAWLAKHEEPA